MSPAKRLSEVLVPGRDYEAKVKITEVLDHEVMLTGFDHVVIESEKPDADGVLVKIVDADYYNVKVDDNGVLKTFSTGAQPIVKILAALDVKLKGEEVDLPLVVIFRKAGQTYTVE